MDKLFIKNSNDKIDVDALIKEHQVEDSQLFTYYLKDIWKDLAFRSVDKNLGINKSTFSQYYALPGMISERLFAVFDRNNNNYLDIFEFIAGMTILFTESFKNLVRFVFNFYDFDKNGKISREDIKVVFSYIPLNDQNFDKNIFRFEKQDFRERIESQEEIYTYVEKLFDKNEEFITQEQFTKGVEELSSEPFIYVFLSKTANYFSPIETTVFKNYFRGIHDKITV